ncbi:Gfo/Idh/MocA family oxidoreductase [Lentisphaera profundi]|uniref:Gfo/Idh/MocA family oxidoreductase n=1 Tax=Lentisphaera profundi TaxID=1658616 RepID=A0ABY7W2I0_9BACT|nr:Gfo/Idh/MocA family oxidoreductase [Lentisphaera profundi]WDE98488.1 Gfo/Idh/MocA family oxidoreductase [Lentisphaera profundi]
MSLNFQPQMPKKKFQIIIIGAGGIVRDSHLPAYKKAGFEVAGIFDLNQEAAQKLANEFAITQAFTSLEAAIEASDENTVWDMALPASVIMKVLEQLPDSSHLLIQKPMGENIEEAQVILDCVKRKKIQGGINFQLRYAPLAIGARDLLEQGALGDLLDMEIKVTCHTPWGLWDFLKGLPRMEILYHSIHYVDLVRSFMGEPKRILAHTVGHPDTEGIASTRTCIIMEYAKNKRAIINTNHDHKFGPELMESYVKWEGTQGAIKAQIGVNMDYPKGRPDYFRYCLLSENDTPTWKEEELPGTWFPDAFIGPMADLMRLKNGEINSMPTSFEDAFQTMNCVEKAYGSTE